MSIAYALLCAGLALRLLTFHRAGGRHRPVISLVAYALIVAAGSVPIRWLFGVPVQVDPSAVVILLALFAAVVWLGGNVAELFRQAGHPRRPVNRQHKTLR